ncbi:MAG: tRNA pseudouridine(55) synthase TruB [Bacteroidota bacterium]|nr:tRNA pseudouridine(55) synthase TruB [Bacteroidota bacterium]
MSQEQELPPSEFVTGKVLLIDKPLTWTSFDAVNKIRWQLKQKLKQKLKVGHAGTLDPLATGLLIICTGKFTKRIDEFQAQEKEYTGTFVIGASTPSSDLEHEVNEYFPTEHITDEMIHSATKNFIGEIDQSPPLFSAIKVDGKRAYKMARKGDETILPTRKVEIRKFEIRAIRRVFFPTKESGLEQTAGILEQTVGMPEQTADIIKVDFCVSCSKGTYIRSLARDFGKALESGAYLSVLRRTRIGEFKIEDAVTIEAFVASLAE